MVKGMNILWKSYLRFSAPEAIRNFEGLKLWVGNGFDLWMPESAAAFGVAL
jgi:hypothetical protein